MDLHHTWNSWSMQKIVKIFVGHCGLYFTVKCFCFVLSTLFNIYALLRQLFSLPLQMIKAEEQKTKVNLTIRLLQTVPYYFKVIATYIYDFVFYYQNLMDLYHTWRGKACLHCN